MATQGSANTPHNVAGAPFNTISSDIASAHGPQSSNVDAIPTRIKSLTESAFKQTEESRGHPTPNRNLQYQVFNWRPYGHREYSERELETAFVLLDIAGVPVPHTPTNEARPGGKSDDDGLDASNRTEGSSDATNQTTNERFGLGSASGQDLLMSEAVGREHLREDHEMHRQQDQSSPAPTERQVRASRAAHNSRMRRLRRAHQQRAWDRINARAQGRMINASIQAVQQALIQENDEAMWG
ncbi:hypothetical protein CBER1_07886 [Cercospora berteroae]|uniref:Uncharacterized protein n=1 Tax=Cercospora berteroae TaxID=357750 RepID=A0A2S6BV00_9PEZI|nr:hypothetical protein CBER1_07886 [Cercospora berteroae]